jgi:hypothetical protein
MSAPHFDIGSSTYIGSKFGFRLQILMSAPHFDIGSSTYIGSKHGSLIGQTL